MDRWEDHNEDYKMWEVYGYFEIKIEEMEKYQKMSGGTEKWARYESAVATEDVSKKVRQYLESIASQKENNE